MDETGIWEEAPQRFSWFADGADRVPLKNLSSKGDRWNLIAAGGREGFLRGATWIKLGKKSAEFHGTITYGVFEDWVITNLLPSIKDRRCIIVMDNAGFHRKMAVSRSKMNKPMMIQWLTKNGVEFDEKSTKKELLSIIDNRCPLQPQLTDILRKAGHELLWLPPYHPELNPIERMWGIIKSRMRRLYNDEPVTQQLFMERFKQTIDGITAAEWNGSCKKSFVYCWKWCEGDRITVADIDDQKQSLDNDDGDVHVPFNYDNIDTDDDDDDINDDVDVIPIDATEPATLEEKVEVGRVAGAMGSSKFGRARRQPFKILTPQLQLQRRWFDVHGPGSEKFTFGPIP